MYPIKAIIIDDESNAIDYLEKLINEVTPEIEIVGKALEARSGLKMAIDNEPDLIFLDIQMPEHDGFWLANKIPALKKVPTLIFVTAFNQYAIDAIKHSAFDFLVKPVDPLILKESVERFYHTCNKLDIQRKINSLNEFLNRDKIKFNTTEGFFFINASDIIFCTADGNYSYIYLTDGTNTLVTHQLGVLEKKLNPFGFLRINRSALINLNMIHHFHRKRNQIILLHNNKEYEFKVSPAARKILNGL